jgi:hypothetical protein
VIVSCLIRENKIGTEIYYTRDGKKTLYLLLLLLSATITLLANSELDTLLLRERDPGLVALANNEDIGNTSSELTVKSILDMDNLKTTNVTFTVSDDTDAAHVTTTSSHADIANFELDEVGDLGILNVITNSIVGLDQRIRVADGTTIMGENIGNALGSELNFANLAELVLGFLIGDAVDSEATFHVIDETEVLTSLLNRDDIFKEDKR